ncbi:BTAD domain-containing putative transcriptional regulator [Kitasatospora sp. NPDC054939]
MDFQILGPVEVRGAQGRVPLSGAKVHTVLAALLLARGRTVAHNRLSELLWGWEPPTTMHAQIYTYISRLRKYLGPDAELVRQSPGYQIRIGSARFDLAEFERTAELGRDALARRRHEEASARLRAALSLWRGPALANVTEFLADAEGPQLAETRLAVVEDCIEADLALGRHRELVGELTGLVGEHPLRERLRAQYMTALYRCDRQADALAAYQAGREVLAEELGVDPGGLLNQVHQAVLNGGSGLAAPAAEPVGLTAPAARRVPAMLPPDAAGPTVRTAELAWLRRALESGPGTAGRARCLQVTGMPGIGRTALAVHAAHSALESFPDGQLYAELHRPDGTPKDPAEVLEGFLRGLGEDPSGSPADLDELVRRYRTATAGRRLLVVLDDVAGDAQLTPLLPNSAVARTLVTSRRYLASVAGPDTLVLRPLDREQSLALLTAVAGPERVAADPAAALEIVRLCAGLPLALRIAGVRLATRPQWPAARLAQLLAPPASRLGELRFGELDVRRSLVRTLSAETAHSRRAMPRLAALGALPFSVTEAAAATGLTEDAAERVLEDLVAAALLEMRGPDDAGRPRYQFHELVRLIARPVRAVPSQVPAHPMVVPQRRRQPAPRGFCGVPVLADRH